MPGLLGVALLCARAAGAEPLLPVPGSDVVSDVDVVAGVVSVRFGFRVPAPPKRVFARVTAFRGLTRVVDGLSKVTSRRAKKGGGLVVRFRGKLMRDYDVSVRVWPKWTRGRGVVRWRVPSAELGEGRLHVDPAPGGSVLTLRTAVRVVTGLPSFLLKLALKTAIAAAGASLRMLLSR